jgi:hypothetical protein
MVCRQQQQQQQQPHGNTTDPPHRDRSGGCAVTDTDGPGLSQEHFAGEDMAAPRGGCR